MLQFLFEGGGVEKCMETEVGIWNCTHTDSEDTCYHSRHQKDTHSSSKVQTRKLFDSRQNKSLLYAKHERIRLMTRKLLVLVPNSQAKRAAASLALTLAQCAASNCEFWTVCFCSQAHSQRAERQHVTLNEAPVHVPSLAAKSQRLSEEL